MIWRVVIAAVVALLVSWIVLIVVLWGSAPAGSDSRSLQQALRLLPDVARLFRRIAADRAAPRGARVRIWLLLAYLALPIDLVPDFLPVIGFADDVILVVVVLRSLVRRAGPEVVADRWPGTPEGLDALWRLAALPPRTGG